MNKVVKKVAIMQPYFFPYIGYWSLINIVDEFVILDDVNFIMRGYINRNSILLNGKAHLFSIPLEKPSQNKLINETKLNFSTKDKETFLKTITIAYKKAPYYSEVFPLIEKIILNPEVDLTKYIKNSIEIITKYLNIDTKIFVSSEITKDNNLKAQARIIEINKQLNSNHYINPIGGLELYNKNDFEQEEILLNFLKTNIIAYPQFKNEFISNLSIIDIMMFNSQEKIKEMLNDCELI